MKRSYTSTCSVTFGKQDEKVELKESKKPKLTTTIATKPKEERSFLLRPFVPPALLLNNVPPHVSSTKTIITMLPKKKQNTSDDVVVEKKKQKTTTLRIHLPQVTFPTEVYRYSFDAKQKYTVDWLEPGGVFILKRIESLPFDLDELCYGSDSQLSLIGHSFKTLHQLDKALLINDEKAMKWIMANTRVPFEATGSKWCSNVSSEALTFLPLLLLS